MRAWLPRGGTVVLAVGDGVDVVAAEGLTGGGDVTDGDRLTRPVGIADAELAGPTGEVVGSAFGGEDGGAAGDVEDADVEDGDVEDGVAAALLRWLEQPAVVAANATVTTVITACDVVRFTFHPHYAF